MNDFNLFVKLLRSRPEYDEMMEQQPDELKSREWLCVLFIRSMIDTGMKVHEMIKYVPKEYIWLLREFIETTIAPRRLMVNWSNLKRSLARVPPVRQETQEYIQAHQPVRSFVISTDA